MDIRQILDAIESLAESSGVGILGKRVVDGEAIIAKIGQLRPLLPSSANALRLTDELEQFVKNSKLGFLGKYIINEEEFFTKIQQLRAALRPAS